MSYELHIYAHSDPVPRSYEGYELPVRITFCVTDQDGHVERSAAFDCNVVHLRSTIENFADSHCVVDTLTVGHDISTEADRVPRNHVSGICAIERHHNG